MRTSRWGIRFSCGISHFSFLISDGHYDGSICIHSLLLEGFREYVAEMADINRLEGVFNTTLELYGNIHEPERSVISGVLEISDLILTDGQDRELIGAGSIRTGLREIDPYRSRFVVDSFVLAEPYIYFELKDSTNNFAEMLKNAPSGTDSVESEHAEADSAMQEGKGEIFYAIRSFRMEEGKIDFRDHISEEPFDYHLSSIAIQTDSIESTFDWITLFASMVLNNQGNLQAETEFNPLQLNNITLDYTISDFQLSDLNIYSKHYTGFPVLYGDMYYRGNTKITDNLLVSDNKLVIQQVELGEKSGGLIDLPLKFALFILKDRNGVIHLDIPVKGKTDEPGVTIGQIVWNTLKNLVVRAATAPYDFLAGMVGVDPDDIKTIEYNYMDTTLTNSRQKQLDVLLELEQLKEKLGIALVYFNDVEQEKERISGLEAVRDTTARDTTGLVVQEKVDSLATLFAETRRQQIRNYLHMKNDSTQIRIIIPDPRSPKNVGSLPIFEVKYSMERAEEEE